MSAWPDSEPVAFRPIVRDDLNRVMAIERGSYQFGWTRGIFEDCLRVGYECWALTHDEYMVGYGIMSFAPGEAHILNLCIDRNEQRQGYGQVLMEYLMDIAVDNGAERMWLEVRPSNHAARQLYRTLRFQRIARRRAYYPGEGEREDALVLSRRL